MSDHKYDKWVVVGKRIAIFVCEDCLLGIAICENECNFKVVYYYQISLYQVEDVSYGLNSKSLLVRINKQSSEIPSIEEVNEKLYDIDGYDCKNASIGEIMVE